MRYASNSSGRVLWTVMNGRLREEGPESFSFTMTATDTHILLGLLLDSQAEIEKSYALEQERHMVAPLDGMWPPTHSPKPVVTEDDAATIP